VSEAVFIPIDSAGDAAPERFLATELARGPWDPAAQHGGAPAALLVRAFERQPTQDGLALARVTYEFLRPVPLGELSVQTEIVRPGRRVQLLEGSIYTPDDVEVVRARALRVRAAEALPAHPTPAPAPAPPDAGRASDFKPPRRPMFGTDALEIRFVEGGFMEPGAATAWFRLKVPLVAGEDTSPLQRLATAADFGNGISSALPWEGHVFINPDLTIYVDRAPVGEWIGLVSRTYIPEGGIGVSESGLYDVHGRVGRAAQALLVAAR
jgi:hypothetical protein